MKLIIYLASNDPSAMKNYNTLIDQRRWTLGTAEVKLQVIEINDHVMRIPNPSTPNVFNKISLNDAPRVELVAHGDGSPWIKCMPLGQWSSESDAVNTYKDINARELRDFFRNYASENGQYKFKDLTLFCCGGYKFGKELAELMPDIKITCFKEYIEILGADGMAYPYTVIKDDKNIKRIVPIDKDGQVITTREQTHYPAAQWILEGNCERAIYACTDAVPTSVASVAATEDPRPITLSGFIIQSPQETSRSSQEKNTESTPSTTESANTQSDQPSLNIPPRMR